MRAPSELSRPPSRPLATKAALAVSHRRLPRAQPLPLLQPLPGWAWAVAFAGGVWSLTTYQPVLTAAAFATLLVVTSLLYIRGESVILFACAGMHWLRSTTALIFAGVTGIPLEKALDYPNQEEAAWLSLGGVLVLAIGMRLAISPHGRGSDIGQRMEADASRMSLSQLNMTWWATFLFTHALGGVLWKLGGFRQLGATFLGLNWVIFFMLAYKVLSEERGYGILLTAVAVQVAVGLTGYFGSFKEVLLIGMVVALSLRRGMSLRIRGIAIGLFVVGVVASMFWSVVKQDYREFLQQQWSQKGGADMMTRLGAVRTMIGRMDSQTLGDGFHTFLARVSYTGLFGSTIAHVPAFEPHSKGELWLGAVQHVLMPRILFPDKEVLDDSARARRFTGIRLAGMEEGTSIGIGYFAESYADFGPIGMMFPIGIMGMLFGRAYNNFTAKPDSLIGAAMATSIVFSELQAYEASNVKIFGGFAAQVLVFWVLYSLAVPRLRAFLSR